MTRSKIVGVIFIVLAVIWMGVIFLFSSQDGVKSEQTSNKVSDVTFDVIYGDKNFPSAESKTEAYGNVSHMVRKLAHMSEYFLLAALLLQGLLLLINKSSFAIIIAIFTSICYASLDEFHQGFVDGRGPSFYDVMIDSCGIAIGAVFIAIIWMLLVSKLKFNDELY